jgi:hypothetical protein
MKFAHLIALVALTISQSAFAISTEKYPQATWDKCYATIVDAFAMPWGAPFQFVSKQSEARILEDFKFYTDSEWRTLDWAASPHYNGWASHYSGRIGFEKKELSRMLGVYDTTHLGTNKRVTIDMIARLNPEFQSLACENQACAPKADICVPVRFKVYDHAGNVLQDYTGNSRLTGRYNETLVRLGGTPINGQNTLHWYIPLVQYRLER